MIKVILQTKKEMLNDVSNEEVSKAMKFLINASGEYKFPQIMESITTQRNLIEDCLSKHLSLENLIEKLALDFDVDKEGSLEKAEADFWNFQLNRMH